MSKRPRLPTEEDLLARVRRENLRGAPEKDRPRSEQEWQEFESKLTPEGTAEIGETEPDFWAAQSISEDLLRKTSAPPNEDEATLRVDAERYRPQLRDFREVLKNHAAVPDSLAALACIFGTAKREELIYAVRCCLWLLEQGQVAKDESPEPSAESAEAREAPPITHRRDLVSRLRELRNRSGWQDREGGWHREGEYPHTDGTKDKAGKIIVTWRVDPGARLRGVSDINVALRDAGIRRPSTDRPLQISDPEILSAAPSELWEILVCLAEGNSVKVTAVKTVIPLWRVKAYRRVLLWLAESRVYTTDGACEAEGILPITDPWTPAEDREMALALFGWRPCAGPGCKNALSGHGHQRYCSRECKQAARHAKRQSQRV